MKLTTKLIVNLKTSEVVKKVEKATEEGLKDVIVDITNDSIKGSPVLSGHNRRSIAYKLGNVVTRTGTPNGNEEAFTEKRLTNLLIAKPDENLTQAIVRDIKHHMGDAQQFDDITILTVSRK